jgi:hypothetical protein
MCTDYSSTRDCFSYIWAYAPNNFRRNKTITLESIFADIDGGVAAVASRTKNQEALRLLDECRAELQAIFQLYKDGRELDAQKRLLAAQKIFSQAGQLKKSDAALAERVEEDYQD